MKTSNQMQYVVSYIAGNEDEGVSSDWIPCHDMTDAVEHKYKIQKQHGFSTVTISKIIERHDD